MQSPIRSPRVIYTDRYLNDPIQFEPDPRFDPNSLLSYLTGSDGTPVKTYDRDQADFVQVNLNSTINSYRMVHMFSPIYDRERYDRTIDRKFTQFVTQSVSNG